MDPVINVILRQITEFTLNHTINIATWRLCEIKRFLKKEEKPGKCYETTRRQKLEDLNLNWFRQFWFLARNKNRTKLKNKFEGIRLFAMWSHVLRFLKTFLFASLTKIFKVTAVRIWILRALEGKQGYEKQRGEVWTCYNVKICVSLNVFFMRSSKFYICRIVRLSIHMWEWTTRCKHYFLYLFQLYCPLYVSTETSSSSGS